MSAFDVSFPEVLLWQQQNQIQEKNYLKFILLYFILLSCAKDNKIKTLKLLYGSEHILT